MIPGELFASISPYLISEEIWNIMKLRPSQRRIRDPQQICCRIWTNVKMDGRISHQVSRSWHSNWQSSFDLCCQINDFLQYLTCHCTVSDVITSYRFLCVELASTFFSLYALVAAAVVDISVAWLRDHILTSPEKVCSLNNQNKKYSITEIIQYFLNHYCTGCLLVCLLSLIWVTYSYSRLFS